MTVPHFHITESIRNTDSYCASCEADSIELTLEKDIVTHMHSLRMDKGERFVLVDPRGHASTYELCEAPPRIPQKKESDPTVRVKLCAYEVYERTTFLTLVQGISTADRMDQTVRQTTELGVAQIIPLQSARVTVRLVDAVARSQKQERWQRIARSAAEQATCAFVPSVKRPCNLTEALAAVADHDVLVVAWEECDEGGIRELMEQYDTEGRRLRVALFVGPEGGFEPFEIEQMRTAGAKPISLGATVLRTETAAVVASALVIHELGGLGRRSQNQ